MGTDKRQVNEEGSTHTERKHEEVHWWAEEQMHNELGPCKATAFIESKRLPTHPCKVTGSTDPKLIEHGIPVKWDQMPDEDFVSDPLPSIV